MGIGFYIFNFVGGVTRWIYGSIWRTIANKPKYKFREYIWGPEDSDDIEDGCGHRFVNAIVGAIILMVICFFLTRIQV